MYRKLTLLGLLLFFPLLLQAESIHSVDSLTLVSDSYRSLFSLYPRPEGSPEEKETAGYIKDRLTGLGISWEETPLDRIEGTHSFSGNITAVIPGRLPYQFILTVPLNDTDPDKPESSINPALALGFLNEWKDRTPPVSIKVLFAGADTRNGTALGSRNFLEDLTYTIPSAVLYLALPDIREVPELTGSAGILNAPGWFMEQIRQALTAQEVGVSIDGTAILINRAGMNTHRLPIREYLKEDIPAASLTGSGRIREDASDKLLTARYLLALNRIINGYENGFPRNNEHNYLYTGLLLSDYLYISEKGLIVLYLIMFTMAILIPLFQERRIYLNFKRFRHQLWTAPVLIYLTFLFFMVATLVIEDILAFRNLPGLWQQYPFLFFLLKIFLGLFLSSLILNILRGLPFPKSPHFYSYTAFVITLFDLIVLTVFNISFSPFLLWSLICTFLFIIVRGKGKKRMLMVLSVLPIIMGLYLLFRKDYVPVYRFLLLSRVGGNWLLTLFSLPFISMLTSLSFYHHHYNRSRQEVRTAFTSIGWGVISLFLIFQIFNQQPFTPEAPQPVSLLDKQDLNRNIRELIISSDTFIGSGELTLGSSRIDLKDIEQELRIRGEVEGTPLELHTETDVFLDRRIINILITAEKPPEEVTVELTSSEPIVFYDSGFPYELSPDEHSARIFIGRNPPVPLEIPMIFARGSAPDFHFTLRYSDTPYELKLDKEPVRIDRRMILFRSLSYKEITGAE